MASTDNPDILKVVLAISKINPAYARKLQFAFSCTGEFAQLEDIRRSVVILRNLDTDAFFRQAISKHQGLDRLAQLLELLRSVLVLMPILLTWLSLSFAVSMFANFHSDIPFLILWQQGFNGQLPDWLRLSNVAYVDAILVGLIMLFTFYINFRQNILNEMSIHRALSLKNDLDSVVWDLDCQLFQKYSVLSSPDEMSLEPLIIKLEGLISAINTQNASWLTYASAESERMRGLSDVQRETTQVLQDSASTFFKASADVVDVLGGLKSNFGDWIDTNLSTSVEVAESFRKVEVALSYLRELNINALQLRDTFNALAQEEHLSSQNVSMSVDILSSKINEIPEQLDSLHIGLRDIQSNSKSVEHLAAKISEIPIQLNSLQQKLQDLQSNTKLVESIAAELTGIPGQLDSIQEGMLNVQSSSKSVEYLSAKLDEFPRRLETIRSDFRDILQNSTKERDFVSKTNGLINTVSPVSSSGNSIDLLKFISFIPFVGIPLGVGLVVLEFWNSRWNSQRVLVSLFGIGINIIAVGSIALYVINQVVFVK